MVLKTFDVELNGNIKLESEPQSWSIPYPWFLCTLSVGILRKCKINIKYINIQGCSSQSWSSYFVTPNSNWVKFFSGNWLQDKALLLACVLNVYPNTIISFAFDIILHQSNNLSMFSTTLSCHFVLVSCCYYLEIGYFTDINMLFPNYAYSFENRLVGSSSYLKDDIKGC